MAGVRLVNLTKQFNEVTAVNNLSLDIGDKEFLVFVGPSGCGKTTALRMIAGLEEITSGEIWIDDGRVNDVPPKDRDIAMVFQNYALYPHMTVYDNMAFGLKLRKVAEAGDRGARARGGRSMLGSNRTARAQAQGSSPAGSASAWRWAAPSCASRRSSSWTSRSPTWTPSCACRCARSSSRLHRRLGHDHDLRHARPGRGHDHGRPHRAS